MSLLGLAFAYIRHRPLVAFLTILSIAFGAALVLVVLNVRRELERSLLSRVIGVDIVVGATGSETALVLNSLFLADQPRGNIPYPVWEGLQRIEGVSLAVPLSLGDQYRGSRIVGTSPDFFEMKDVNGARVHQLQDGKRFAGDFEIVAGAEAARRLGLTVGSQFVSSHGILSAGEEHDEHPYTVVGILAPTGTPYDRGLFTTMASYWTVHGQVASRGSQASKEVTSVLLSVRRPMVLQLKAQIPRLFGSVMAVRPAEVLQGVFSQVLAPIERLLLAYGYAVAVVASLSVLTTLYLSTLLRQKDLGILRAIGAAPREVLGVVLWEAIILLVIGTAVGILMSQLLTLVLRGDLEGRFGVHLQLFQFTVQEWLALFSIFGLGLLASLLPAVQAYRFAVVRSLVRAS